MIYKDFKKGMTIIEIIIVIFIIGAISSIVFINLSSFRNDQALRGTVSDIISTLNKAKQNTLSSINSTNYGVHFESNRFILFPGSTYSSSEPKNEITNLNSAISIPTPSGLNIGGGSDVVFERLTGDTIGGTIKIQVTSDVNKYKIITISKTGAASSN